MGSLTQPGAGVHFPSVGRWGVTVVPAGWIYVAEFGIRQMTTAPTAIAANVCLGQNTLDSESGIVGYIEKQKDLIGGHLKDAKFGGPQALAFADANEAQLLFVRHSVDKVGTMLHAQTYVRMGDWLGIITLTTLETQLKTVRPDYEAFVSGLRISQQRSNASEVRSQQVEPSRENA